MDNIQQCQIEIEWEPTKDPRATNHKLEIYAFGQRKLFGEINLPPSSSYFTFNCIDGTAWHIVSRTQIEDDDGNLIDETLNFFDIKVPVLANLLPANNFKWHLSKVEDLPNLPEMDNEDLEDIEVEESKEEEPKEDEDN